MWKTETVLVHSARTAVVAIVSVPVARLFQLPQKVLGCDHHSGDQAIVAGGDGRDVLRSAGIHFWRQYFPSRLTLRSDEIGSKRVSRFGGIAPTIVLLVPRTGFAWQVAFHRFSEVSIGIVVALILTVVWPERE